METIAERLEKKTSKAAAYQEATAALVGHEFKTPRHDAMDEGPCHQQPTNT